jgi:hypothetical protein
LISLGPQVEVCFVNGAQQAVEARHVIDRVNTPKIGA